MAASDDPPTASAGADALERARSAFDRGDHRAGLEAATQAGDHARGAGDGRAVAASQLLRAQHLSRLGRLEEAAAAAHEAIRQWHSLSDAAGECEALCTLSEASLEVGRVDEALHSATNACELVRRHGLASLAPGALARMGLCHSRIGDAAQGEQQLLASLEQARQLRSAECTLLALDGLAAAALEGWRRGRRGGQTGSEVDALQRARDHAEQALALAERLQNDARTAAARGRLAEVKLHLGDLDEAQRLIESALERSGADGLRLVELAARCTGAELQMVRGELQQASDTARALLDALRAGDHEPTRLRAHATLWACAKTLGRFEDALAHCEACYAIDLRRTSARGPSQAPVRWQADVEAPPASAPPSVPSALPDDRDIEREIQPLFDQVRFRRKPLALAAIEVDGLGALRTRAGAAAAQAALREIGSLMRQRLRGRDLALRRGADAFLLVLGDTPPAAAQAICERVRAAVHQHDWSRMSQGAPLSLSVGLVNVIAGREPASELARADAALRTARAAGGNQVQAAGAA